MPVNPTSINLADLNGTNGFKISGEEDFAYSGFSVSSAGDVNGDGFADLIIGANYADAWGTDQGASYVVFGRGDNNFSGGDGNLDLSELNGANGFQISGEEDGAYSGFSVSSAGDVNGDGFADLIIGAYSTDAGGNNRGASYVVFGKASGFAANLNLSSLNGSNGFQISSDEDNARSGICVSGAGDVNGDGFADLIIGANYADAWGTDQGASYVIYGRATGTLNRTFTDASEVIGGGDWDDVLIGLGGNDTINGGAGDDQLDGGADNDVINGGDGDDTIIGGSGGDQINGESGDDVIKAGSGDDYVYLGEGADDLNGGSGNFDHLDVQGFFGSGGTVNFLTGLAFMTGSADVSKVAGFELATGSGGNDTMTGNAAANQFYSGGGNDTLDGGLGADLLQGDAGNDTYVLGAESDTVVETTGIDTITSTITRSLAGYAAIENLTLLGTAAINGTGNGLANVITGNAGKNILNGATGIDTLVGGLGIDTLIGGDVGQDRFRFNALTEGGDLIQAFDVNDVIQLKATAFLGLTNLNKGANFVIRAVGHAAADANDRLIFQQSDDTLWYDSNGSLAGGTIVKIADLTNNFNMTAADIVMV